MANPISKNLKIGTIGELLVQLRLLQCGIQAAPPLKDSGNDLIAIKGESFMAVQVKTSTKECINLKKMPKLYHLLALVNLKGNDDDILLDKTEIYLLKRDDIVKNNFCFSMLSEYRLTKERIDDIFKSNYKS